jgi:Ca2+-binding EF-hand superfamily protein
MKVMGNAILLALFLAGVALAAEQEEEQPASTLTFDELDTNHDGYISKTEASVRKDLTKGWKTADKDKDGKLDVSEFSAFEAKERYTIEGPEISEPEPGAAPLE